MADVHEGSGGLARAGLLENARFNALVIVPNAVQGIFRRRRAPVAVATRAGIDGQAVGLLRGMARSSEGRPVWVQVIKNPALLLLDPADIERVLEGSPDPYASDPPAKRDGMVAFQPDAATISRGALWRNRRRFNEAVLRSSSGRSGGGKLLKTWESICSEELERLLTGPVAVSGGEIGWDPFHECVQRIARRLILGDGAAEDERLTELLGELMSDANGMPGESGEGVRELEEMIGRHVERADRGSLAARFATAPADGRTNTLGQVPHWLFALGDTLAINALRALAVLASDDHVADRARESREYLSGCLQEAMRLWPTTAMLSRETTEDVELRGETVPAGTQVLIVNTFSHRDRDRVDYADRFTPEAWMDGRASAYGGFNFFSRGPQICPGTAIATGVGESLLAELLDGYELEALSPQLDLGEALPHMVDFFGIRVGVEPR